MPTPKEIRRLKAARAKLFWPVNLKERDEQEGLASQGDIPFRRKRVSYKRTANKGKKRATGGKRVRASSVSPVNVYPAPFDLTYEPLDLGFLNEDVTHEH